MCEKKKESNNYNSKLQNNFPKNLKFKNWDFKSPKSSKSWKTILHTCSEAPGCVILGGKS